MYSNKAVDMMVQCAESYRDETILRINERQKVINNHASGVYAVIKHSTGTLTIIFRGTDSKRDWISNFMFAKKCVPYANYTSPIRVHTGFIRAYKSVREIIHEEVRHSTRQIYLGGHSRGAALATLCAVDIRYNFPHRDVELYAYGSPRVGNKAFAKSFNKRIDKALRIKTKWDIITMLPPSILGYSHVGMGFSIIGECSLNTHSPIAYVQSLLSTFEFIGDEKLLYK